MFQFLIVLLFYNWKVGYGIVIEKVIFISSSGKKDYALVNEGFTVSCIFLLERDEQFKKIELFKNQNLIYSYEIESDRRTEFGILKGQLDLKKISPSSIAVQKATLGMHGEYSCKVLSNKSTFISNFIVTIIKDDCKESNWTTHTDMVFCEEHVRLDCKGMFPKPAPVCGVYNEWSENFMAAVPFDSIIESEDGTYQLSMFHRYKIKDYQDYIGYLSFRCEITVPGTSWKREMSHQMFGGRGCSYPNGIQNGKFFLNPNQTCQISPRTGAILKYNCFENYTLNGSDTFICDHGFWKVFHSNLLVNFSSIDQSSSLPISRHIFNQPYCNKSLNWLFSSSMLLILLISLFNCIFIVIVIKDK